MNHPLVAAASGVLFGCVLCTSAYLVHQRPAPLAGQGSQAVVVVAPVVVTVVVPPPLTRAVPHLTDIEDETITDCAAPKVTLRAAQQAYVTGQYDTAINLAELCVQVEPQRANRIIGAASCVLHDLDCLRTAYRGADTAGRQYMVYTCQRNGVTFRQSGRHWIAEVSND